MSRKQKYYTLCVPQSLYMLYTLVIGFSSIFKLVLSNFKHSCESCIYLRHWWHSPFALWHSQGCLFILPLVLLPAKISLLYPIWNYDINAVTCAMLLILALLCHFVPTTVAEKWICQNWCISVFLLNFKFRKWISHAQQISTSYSSQGILMIPEKVKRIRWTSK